MKNTLKCLSILSSLMSLSLTSPALATHVVTNSSLASENISKLVAQDITNNAQYWYNLGDTFSKDRNYQEAIAAYDRAIRINSNWADAWLGRGLALWHLGRYEESLEAYTQATEIDPNYSLAWFNQGVLLNDLGRYEEALISYNLALQVDQNWGTINAAEVWFGLGQSLANLDKNQASFNAYDRATRLEPNYSGYWHGRGHILVKLGRYEEALISLDRAFEGNGKWGDSSEANALVDKGVALEYLGRYSEARSAYQKALELDPDNTFAKENLANLQQY